MRYVRREVPVTESRPEKSKKGLYRITDPFLRFWFRYVHSGAALEMRMEAASTIAAFVYLVRPTI